MSNIGSMVVGHSDQPERLETVKIKMKLDKNKRDLCEKDIQLLIKRKPDLLKKSGEMDVSYSINVEYFNCAEELRAVRRICETPGVVVSIGMKELNHGEFLLHECLKEVDRIKHAVKV